MKQLTCEMCGSTDLMKQDGVFVCQTCGCKYSVEEAKRMMVEGTIEVSNLANIENLLKLAKSAYDSKNYQETERICNQIIGLDSNNYEGWFLKGKAVNLQINANNPRVLEVYNCIMTAYRTLNDNEKEEKRDEVIDFLINCFMGEVDFWLENLGTGRPTADNLYKAKMAHLDSKYKLEDAIEEILGHCEESLIPQSFTEYYIAKANQVCKKVWKTTVGYNYYREYFDTLGKNWDIHEYSINEYRPTDAIWETFLHETDNLIDLLKYCEEQFSDDTESDTKIDIYDNIIYFHTCLIKSKSYYWRVGGAYLSSMWRTSYQLNDDAKELRRGVIREYQQKIDKEKENKILKEEAESRKRIEEYWNEHKDEKEKLESEKQKLEAEIKVLLTDIDNILEKQKVVEINNLIEQLTKEKESVGIFKRKERKELQNQMEEKLSEKKKLEDIISNKEEKIRISITNKENRVAEIEEELTKER